MKIIAIGDIHASGFNDDPIINGYPARLSYIKDSLDFIVDYGRKHKIKDYVILGDIYNDKTIIYNASQDMLVNFFMINFDLHFTMISGNHDLSATGQNQKSAISVFQKYPNIHCILKDPEVIDFYNGVFIPYTRDFISEYKKLDIRSNKILFAHVGLNEGVLQSGLSKVDKLRISDINKFKLLILGHYHKPQKIETKDTVGYYVGSLIPKDWNDKNEQKRFLVVDTETLEVESVNIECKNIPQFKEYVITDNIDSSERNKIIEEANKERKNGHKVRVINKSKIKMTKEEKESIADMILLESSDVDITNRGITVTQSKLEQCKKYLEIKEIKEESQKYIDRLNEWKLLQETSHED